MITRFKTDVNFPLYPPFDNHSMGEPQPLMVDIPKEHEKGDRERCYCLQIPADMVMHEFSHFHPTM